MKNRILSALLLTLLTGKALSFWQQGHLMVARIAYDILEKEAPEALTQANTVLKTLQETNPKLIVSENDYPFVECATFADEIKSKGYSFQSNWHFVDIPYFDEGGSLDDYPGFQLEPNNITTIVPALMDWISGNEGYKNTYAYQQIMTKFNDDESGKSFALRLLIHYVGDIHQPLHASSRVDSKYPKGDAGGNFFKVTSKDGAKNLHSVWDAGVYFYANDPNLPYNSNDWNALTKVVNTIENKFQISSSETDNLDISQWAQESFELTKSNVYNGVEENKAVPQSYVDNNEEPIQKQIVLGGMRLAYVIKTIFGSSKAVSQEVAFLQ